MARKRLSKRRRAMIRVPVRASLGSPPGVFPADGSARFVSGSILRYQPNSFSEETLDASTLLSVSPSPNSMLWLDVQSGDGATLAALGSAFEWHPLVLEDVASSHQRPKVEDYGEYIYAVVRMPTGQPPDLPFEQLNLLISRNYVVTIQGDCPGDCLEPVRNRLRTGVGIIGSQFGDYLSYALIDAVVDHYFPIVERLNERLEDIEGRGFDGSRQDLLGAIHSIRSELHLLWRTLASTREALNILVRSESGLLQLSTRQYLRDCQDHCNQLLDSVQACRELSSSLMELFQAEASNRMSEGMSVLTVVSTVFIPMSFVAGVYGMNFERTASPFNMPELGWAFGYPLALTLMISTGVGFLLYFRHKGWLPPGSSGSAQNGKNPES